MAAAGKAKELDEDGKINEAYFTSEERHKQLAALVFKSKSTPDSLAVLEALSHGMLLMVAKLCKPIDRTPSPPPPQVNEPPEVLVCELSETLAADWQKKQPSSEQPWTAAVDFVKKLDNQSVSHTVLAGSARPIARAFLIQSLTYCFSVRVAPCRCVLCTGKIPKQ